MRVAIVAAAAPARNAIGNLVAEKAEFFAERGAEVRVLLQSTVSLDRRLRPFAQPVDAAASHGPIWDDLVGCDLVFFEYSQDFPLLGWLPRLVGARPRVVVDYYGVSPSDGWPAPQRRTLEEGLRKRSLIGFADAVVVLSRFCRDELERSGVAEERIVQQRIPLDRDVWRLREARPPSDPPVLLFVGRLAPNKRLPLAIEALALLDERRGLSPPDRNDPTIAIRSVGINPTARPELWIAGDCSDIYSHEARRCRELAARLGVADRIRWHGPVDDLPAFYRQADVLVMPSLHEGLGIPVLEAQASGVPVVAARSTALVETVGVGGLLFEPDDVDDFVCCLRAALKPEIAADLRRRGLERVRGWSRPDWRRDFGEFVERLLDAEPAARRRAILLRSPRTSLSAEVGACSMMVPVVIENVGDLPIANDMPMSIALEMRDEATGYHESTACEARIAEPIPAGGSERVSLAVNPPIHVGNYALTLSSESGSPLELSLTMTPPRDEGLSHLLGMAEAAVAAAECELPSDYVDVTEGWLAPLKRWLKRKLLGNFKVGYVDAVHRQQSETNRRLVDAVRQLAECCRELERRSHSAPGLPGKSVDPMPMMLSEATCDTPGKPGAM